MQTNPRRSSRISVLGGLAACTAFGFSATAAHAASTVTVNFSQGGFASGGSISGFFTGTDTDGDGQLYAASRGISDIFGLPFGNELEYAEVILEGFGSLDGTTLVYDASVSDMEEFENLFMAFSYNLDGGEFGDEANEGWSFLAFAPSINYQLGAAWTFVWDDSILPSPTFGRCGSGQVCGGVVQYVPADTPTGAEMRFFDGTTASVETTVVPVPGALALMLSGCGVMGAAARRRRS